MFVKNVPTEDNIVSTIANINIYMKLSKVVIFRETVWCRAAEVIVRESAPNRTL